MNISGVIDQAYPWGIKVTGTLGVALKSESLGDHRVLCPTKVV